MPATPRSPILPREIFDRADTIQLSSLKDPNSMIDPSRTVELSRAENSKQQINLFGSKDATGDSSSNLPYDMRGQRISMQHKYEQPSGTGLLENLRISQLRVDIERS